jgi:hypothetical protein
MKSGNLGGGEDGNSFDFNFAFLGYENIRKTLINFNLCYINSELQ